MCGPGAGALWGRDELLERMEPFLTGGEMIGDGLARAHDLERDPVEVRGRHARRSPSASASAPRSTTCTSDRASRRSTPTSRSLIRYGHDLLRSIPGVTVFGPPPERRAGILTFNVADIHPHDVAQVLDADAICVRAGHHCTQPVRCDRYGRGRDRPARASTSTTRPPTSTGSGEGIERVKRTFGVYRV